MAYRLLRIVALLGMVLLSGHPAFADQGNCTIVLMHGKWGGAKSPHLDRLATALASQCAVERPDMPWSRSKVYNRSYPDALSQVHEMVVKARSAGSTRVFIGGMSMGANAALAYQATYGDADGLILIAPGHLPDRYYAMEEGTRKAVDAAKQLVREGKSDVLVPLRDSNQGQRKTFPVKAAVLISYFDPEGSGVMLRSAKGITKATPTLYVVGARDPLYVEGPGFIYAHLPSHAGSRYSVIKEDHAGTPDAATVLVNDWVRERLQP